MGRFGFGFARKVFVVSAMVMVLVSCGSDGDDESGGSATTTSTTTAASGGASVGESVVEPETTAPSKATTPPLIQGTYEKTAGGGVRTVKATMTCEETTPIECVLKQEEEESLRLVWDGERFNGTLGTTISGGPGAADCTVRGSIWIEPKETAETEGTLVVTSYALGGEMAPSDPPGCAEGATITPGIGKRVG